MMVEFTRELSMLSESLILTFLRRKLALSNSLTGLSLLRSTYTPEKSINRALCCLKKLKSNSLMEEWSFLRLRLTRLVRSSVSSTGLTLALMKRLNLTLCISTRKEFLLKLKDSIRSKKLRASGSASPWTRRSLSS